MNVPAHVPLRSASGASPSGHRPVPRWALLSLVLLLGLGLAEALWIGAQCGAFADPEATVFALPDPQEYHAVAEWIAGARDLPVTASQRRPILYPLLLALIRPAGAGGVIAVQALLYLGSGVLLFRALLRRAGALTAVLGVAALFAHPSLAALVHEGHTETLVVFLWCAVLAGPFGAGDWLSPRVVCGTTLILSLLTITKPLYQLHLALYVGLVLSLWVRRRGPWPARAAALLAGVAPVVAQAGLMWVLHGRPFVSTIFADTLRDCFFPKLYLRTGGAYTLEEARAAVATWPAGAERALALAHPKAVLQTWWDLLLWDNLSQKSMHLPAEGLWQTCSSAMNLWLARLHVPMAAVMLLYLWRSRDVRAAFVWWSAGLVVLTSGISFWQGDRLIIVALPLFLYAYALALASLLPRLRTRWNGSGRSSS